MAKTKIAILGGGMGSIATAYQLTATPELRKQYAVTIYQVGWRIGGKGASGRGPEPIYRIEEHGLHCWFGFYNNAFRMMRDCYSELARSPEAPLATWDQAFLPCDDFILYENYKGRWIPHSFHATRNNHIPGDGQSDPTFWEIVENALGWILSLCREHQQHLSTSYGSPLPAATAKLEAFHLSMPTGNLSALPEGAALITLLLELRNLLAQPLSPVALDDDRLRYLFTSVDFATAVFRGILAENLLEQGFHAASDLDFRDWLRKYGAHPITLDNSIFVRMVYSAAFAFIDGDVERPNYATGVALSCILAVFFCYKGALLYEMAAGMGDAVFAPFYEVLSRRGVDFKFFHAVAQLHIAGNQIDSIDMVEQVTLKDGDYDPLISVPLESMKGRILPCWPNRPRWEQIADGDELRKSGINLETSNPDEASRKTLSRGKDFDLVVLGISVAALPDICSELSADDLKFRAMLDHSATTMTQAFQVWSKQDLKSGLRWPLSTDFIVSTYIEPLDTYKVMNQLLDAENWPAQANLKGIHYFCGVINDVAGEGPSEAEDRAKQNAIDYLENNSGVIWPGAHHSGTFDWETLVDCDARSGSGRFDAQFSRANFAKTERYVLSPARSIKYRLKSDGTRYTNLFLTGDWIDTGINAGCIEAAVTAGMLAARAIKGTDEPIGRADDKWLAAKATKQGNQMSPAKFSEQMVEVANLTTRFVATGARAFASGARITGQGLSSVVGRATQGPAAPAQAAVSSNAAAGSVGDAVQRLTADATQGVNLLFDLVAAAAEGVAAVVEGLSCQPQGIGGPPSGGKTVAILGGGVAGMSAAQELVRCGYDVTVYEAGAVPGGKARTIYDPNTGTGQRSDLPGEHGFRFFPGFYQNLIATMQQIPYPHPTATGTNVAGNLVSTTEVGFATGAYSLVPAPARFPETWNDVFEAADALMTNFAYISPLETAWFINRLLCIATSCDARRNTVFEGKSWWQFTDAQNRSDLFQKFYAIGMTRCSVACDADIVSARSAGMLVLQLIFKLFSPGGQADRVLNGPTSEVWLQPWLEYLQSCGVKYLTGQRVTKFKCDTAQKIITGVEVTNAGGGVNTITADYYIAAIPGDMMSGLVAPLVLADPELANISKLTFEWMNGLQLFLANDVQIAEGHVIFFDAPWALTGVSQQQFWSDSVAEKYGNGSVKGIYSIDISNWKKDGVSVPKPAKNCTLAEIKQEALYQLGQHKDKLGQNIDFGAIQESMLDPDIKFSPGAPADNTEPLMVTATNSLQWRPAAVTAVSNLFLAGDYVRTSTDAITMEGANEAARRAVNGILDAAKDLCQKCQVWELREPLFLEWARIADEELYQLGYPNPFELPFGELAYDGGDRWLTTEFRNAPPEAVKRFRRGIDTQIKIVRMALTRRDRTPGSAAPSREGETAEGSQSSRSIT